MDEIAAEASKEMSGELSTAFHDVPYNARGHLGLYFYAAAYQIVYSLRCEATETDNPLEKALNEHPFLASYFAQIRGRLPENIDWEQSLEWLRDSIFAWEAAGSGDLPLIFMRNALRLSYEAMLAFVIAGMVEEQAEFGALFASLQHPSGERRASLGFMQHLLQREDTPDAWVFVRAMIESGFLQVLNRDIPRSEWIARIPAPLWNAVRGDRVEEPVEGVRYHAIETLEPFSELLIDDQIHSRLRELASLAASGDVRTMLFRGMPGTDRLGAIGAIARQLGCGIMEIEAAAASPGKVERWKSIGPLCALTHSVPVFSLEAGPGETFELPPLAGYAGPIAVMIGREGGIGGAHAANAVTLHLDLESPAKRLEIWGRALPESAPPTLAEAASAFCMPGKHIRQCARLATTYAAIERRPIGISDVRSAARTLNRQSLDTLATRVDGEASWSQLIVKESTSHELEALERRCWHREQLATAFKGSMPGGMNRGVRALFEGPSGTGKTLAARVLATELGLDLYRVDLAAVVNKYIGETEKNLSRVLSRAEDLNVVLLLDEGDSLMSRRTEVKSSNDRNANLETNYLLQRLEHYTGIVLVTTNAGQSIDSAFRRRMDAAVNFQVPGPSDRWRLWLVHLPLGHSVDSTDLEEISVRYELTGGQIRNVCVNAALAALSHGESTLRIHHLNAAIQTEHRKAGASFIGSMPATQARNHRAIKSFSGGLT